MEKTAVKHHIWICASDIIVILIAVLAAGSDSVFTSGFIFLFCAYSYMRSVREGYLSVGIVMLCMLAKGLLPAYFYALGFACFFILIYIVQLCNQNIYEWMPYICALVVIPFSIQEYFIDPHVVLLPIFVFAIMKQNNMHYGWIRKSFVMSQSMYSIVIYMMLILISQMFPLYQNVMVLIALLFIAMIGDIYNAMIMIMMSWLMLGMEPTIYFMIPILLAMYKASKGILFLFLGMLLLFLPRTMWDYTYIGMAMLIALCVDEKKTPFLEEVEVRASSMDRLTSQSMVRRQIQNYAGIFQNLSQYYANINDVESDLLASMASALQYQAEEIQKIDDMGNDDVRLKKALEGYQFEVEDINIEEIRDGCISMDLTISNIRRGEIKTTLKPLLEALLHRKLEIEEIHARRFGQGFDIQCSDHIPFDIEACAKSMKNSYTSNGDTYSIFKFRQSMICMISDGMGNGEKAAQSSRVIISLFQRMMISGIPQDSAIRCINKLIQSDTYATLDVICFHRSRGVAYISKSAACPTFLIRDQVVYEIQGSALPVGIISVMQPDCFEVELKHNDEFIMISDGIEQSELTKWLTTRKGDDVQEDMDSFMEMISQIRRKDDSTIIVAKTREIM